MINVSYNDCSVILGEPIITLNLCLKGRVQREITVGRFSFPSHLVHISFIAFNLQAVGLPKNCSRAGVVLLSTQNSVWHPRGPSRGVCVGGFQACKQETCSQEGPTQRVCDQPPQPG